MSDWTDNPRLNSWLARQEAAFPAWSVATGQQWDFSVESLDRLEKLLLDRFGGWDDMLAAEEAEDPDVMVPGWYIGEVQNRNCGTSWHRNPVEPTHPDQPKTPFVQLPDDPGAGYEDDIPPGNNPFTEIRGLFVPQPNRHLRDVVTRYH
ncbi:hypothetical protein AMIS_24720 [Actinoplanes missouriensis 431]|uniref:Uncharacterized protein n=1 Tax=Actinoplanes missouriensis (strain ATCC 14538 / DSM 43046 / CBS 188.64 / JCM 3121 / NBRC 102363 / NCIMB 12654 / NRRL B-3342 / UNCC 431) TaxID=512565 RepID=I0H3V5_ACTM4|nr:hypothetical protein [Actinoplanes missouriensis]BAL87692.1 hypothetical protein AMIS_24720 [Actinoplanes missouriensis 431]